MIVNFVRSVLHLWLYFSFPCAVEIVWKDGRGVHIINVVIGWPDERFSGLGAVWIDVMSEGKNVN